MPGRGLLLALDSATRRMTVALDGDGLRASRQEDRAGRSLLDLIDDVLRDAARGPSDLRGIVVGSGPGSFTGLRVALATAKTLAWSLHIPLVGVATVEALAEAIAGVGADDHSRAVAVVLPAGARDHYLARMGRSEHGDLRLAEPVRLLPADADLSAAVGDDVAVAIELVGEPLGAEAAARGGRALAALGQTLSACGRRRLAAGRADDLATLVPEYVALPRGIAAAAAEVAWSPDLR